MMSLIELFLKSVKFYADRLALWVENEFYSYSQLFDIAVSISNILRQFSAERCVILSHRNIIAYSSIVGALLADKTYAPLNPSYPIKVNINLLESIDTDLLIVDAKLAEYALAIAIAYKKTLIMIFDSPNATTLKLEKTPHTILYINKSDNNYFYQIFRNPNAYLLFTSGSTGQPKGILISHKNVMTYVENMLLRSQPNETDRFSQLADLTFDFSVHDLFVAWSCGACVYSISKNHLIHWQHFMSQYHLTFWASVPSVVQFLFQTNQLKPDYFISLRYSIFCGDILSHSLASFWQRAAPNSLIDNLYGPTESTVACTGYLWRENKNLQTGQIVPIGFPFPEQEYQIINGELCLTGRQKIA
jgi:D-alanine--poly(phosphoribitol) ligase subunit 1